MRFLEHISKINGYNSAGHFIDSTFHPSCINSSVVLSSVFASIAYYFESIFGMVLPVGILVLLLFALELFTGVKASKREGKGFSSEKFQKGWLKLFVYFVFIACTNLAARYISIKPIFGFSFNVYEWIHYAFYNYVIIQLFISNLENFVRLGWDDFSPIIGKLASAIGIKKEKTE
jgi:phage-related holin